MSIHNMAELEAQMNDIINNMLSSITNKLLTKLQNRIEEDTYDHSNHRYFNDTESRTGDFKNSFEWQNIKHSMKENVKELFYNWNSMKVRKGSGDNWDAHYNDPYKGGSMPNENGFELPYGDIRQYLAEYLNIDGEAAEYERKAYWDNYIKELNRDFSKLAYDEVQSACKRYGLTVKRA